MINTCKPSEPCHLRSLSTEQSGHKRTQHTQRHDAQGASLLKTKRPIVGDALPALKVARVPLLTLLFALSLFTGIPKSAATADIIALDYTGLQEIQILGDGGRTIIHTDQNATPQLTVTGKGGMRFWCDAASVEASRRAARLVIAIADADPTCSVTIALAIPPGLDLVFDQNASVAELEGEFNQINVTSFVSRISLKGSLERFSVTGQTSVIDADITPAQTKSLVDINVGTLVADIGYPLTLPVDYRVNAPVTVFTKGIPLSTDSPHKTRLSAKNVIKGSVFGF